jgi:hypothetical protein
MDPTADPMENTVETTVESKIADVLREHATAGYTGVLHVDGLPGGKIHLLDGGIYACETSGAPSLEVILLRSRRISESAWNAAFAGAAIAEHQMTVELVARQLLGAGELEALLRTALADAMFALVSGPVDGWTESPAADCLLPLDPAAKVGWLLAEAARRQQVLASFGAPAMSAHDRIIAAPPAALYAARAGRVPVLGRDQLLRLADGRRTPRDMAFALGRGVYATMLQLTRMRAENLVAVALRDSGNSPSPSVPTGIASDLQGDDRPGDGLPLRRKDLLGSQRGGEAGRRNFSVNMQMLRPRRSGSATPGQPSNPWLPAKVTNKPNQRFITTNHYHYHS